MKCNDIVKVVKLIFEKYLEGYYKEHVVPIPKLAFDKGKKHKIVAHKPNKKHKFLMKLLTIATFAVMGISALFGGKGNKKDSRASYCEGEKLYCPSQSQRISKHSYYCFGSGRGGRNHRRNTGTVRCHELLGDSGSSAVL